MTEKMLPLLSDGLRRIVENIREKHPNCDIVKELLLADDLIIGYNREFTRQWSDDESSVMIVLREKIESLINDEARMLSFRYNTFEISYLPKGKQAIYTDTNTWCRDNRQTAKPARLIQKLLLHEFKCKEFEDFSNWIKNEIINAGEFVLVSGSDITKYYNEKNYLEVNGTLGNSCMRHEECEDYLQIYEDNAKLLICKKNNKIIGRAIVWELPEGTFMDRIYTCEDYLVNQFIDYARNQKWHYRCDNSLLSDGDYQEWYGPEDNYYSIKQYDLTIELPRVYEFVPYVDSFRYYNRINNSINTNPERGSCCLSTTDGSYSEDDLCTYTCECCGESTLYSEDEIPCGWVFSEWEDGYLCENCSVYCDGINDYVARTTLTSDAFDENSCLKTYPDIYLEDSEYFVLIGDTWYHKDCELLTFDKEQGTYILK